MAPRESVSPAWAARNASCAVGRSSTNSGSPTTRSPSSSVSSTVPSNRPRLPDSSAAYVSVKRTVTTRPEMEIHSTRCRPGARSESTTCPRYSGPGPYTTTDSGHATPPRSQ